MKTPDAPATRRIAPAQLADTLNDNPAPVIIDVRTPAEYETAHITGSFNVPLDTMTEHRDRIAAAALGDTVLVCRSGQRAAQASEALRDVGMGSVGVLGGGIQAWRDAGYDVTEGTQKWELERQVRLVAGGIVLTSILASTVAPRAKWVAGFIGAGLTFAAVSNTCGMAMLLAKLPYNQRNDIDIRDTVNRLTTAR